MKQKIEYRGGDLFIKWVDEEQVFMENGDKLIARFEVKKVLNIGYFGRLFKDGSRYHCKFYRVDGIHMEYVKCPNAEESYQFPFDRKILANLIVGKLGDFIKEKGWAGVFNE